MRVTNKAVVRLPCHGRGRAEGLCATRTEVPYGGVLTRRGIKSLHTEPYGKSSGEGRIAAGGPARFAEGRHGSGAGGVWPEDRVRPARASSSRRLPERCWSCSSQKAEGDKVDGGLTEMAYLTDYDAGYFFSINTESDDAFDKVSKTIRAYVTRELQKPTLPSMAVLPTNASAYAGWYEPDSPEMEITHFIERLLGIARVRFDNSKLFLTSLGERNQVFAPVAGTQFRHIPKKGLPDPAPSLDLLPPNGEGQFIQLGDGMVTMKRIPGWFVIAEILLAAWFVLAAVSVLVYAPFWLVGWINQRRRRPAEHNMRLWPLIAVLSLIAGVVIIILTRDDLISRMGNLTAWSAAFFLATVIYAVASVASAVALWRAPREGVRSRVRKYSMAVTLALLIAAAYLAYWGIIGLRTWA